MYEPDGPSKITVPLLEETYEKLLVAADPDADAGGKGNGEDLDASQYFKIVDSFDLPAWRWDDIRGGFEKSVRLQLETPLRLALTYEWRADPRLRRRSLPVRSPNLGTSATGSTSSSRSSSGTSTSVHRPWSTRREPTT